MKHSAIATLLAGAPLSAALAQPAPPAGSIDPVAL